MIKEAQKLLRRLRAKGMSRRDIAVRLGVCEDTILNWENEIVRYPRTRVLDELRELAA